MAAPAAQGDAAPYYLPIRDEVEVFTEAYACRLPVLLKGPTGCGKTRFVEYMAQHLLPRTSADATPALITVACHEDLTGSDLVGRYLIQGDDTVWIDGPLTQAVRSGAICYLDEVVEARKDTIVLIHPLTDHRRILPIDKRGEILEAHDSFLLVISYNPGYQSVLKDLKESTKQRFGGIEFRYPDTEIETEIVAHEAGIGRAAAEKLVKIGQRSRNLKGHGLDEGASTRMLIQAGRLIAEGVALASACEVALVLPITDDADIRGALSQTIAACA
jgi:nitric oxide reductase NorQ protein